MFRKIPTGGLALCTIKSLKLSRTRMFVMILCGPLANALCIVVALTIGSIWPQHKEPVDAMWLVVVFEAFMLFAVLWPRQYLVGAMFLPSDGLLLLKLARMSRAEIEQSHSLWFYCEGLDSLQCRQTEQAREWFERGLQRYPSSLHNIDRLRTGAVGSKATRCVANPRGAELAKRPKLDAAISKGLADAMAAHGRPISSRPGQFSKLAA